MGRKIAMKKIENITKCQVTFSKRRSSLMKKANEIAVCCDADVAFVAFSPSGRVSKFSNHKRIEDVLNRYVDLTPDKRLNHITNVEAKMDKLKQLSHINGDNSKLQFLDKQIENLELQIKKSGLELQILETDLRDYEVGAEQEASLHQLSWCERNLNQSLQRIMARKMELQTQNQAPFPYGFNEIGQASTSTNPFTAQFLMQLDPWISPYNARVRDSLLQDLFDQGEHTANFPIQEPPPAIPIPPPRFPLEQSFTLDQSLLNFHDQINVNAWDNTSHVVFSDATHMSTPNLCNTQVPRSVGAPIMRLPHPNRLEMPQSVFDEMGRGGLQYANPDLTNNMEGQQLNMDLVRNGNEELGDYCLINRQPPNPNEAIKDAVSHTFLSKDANVDNAHSTSNVQGSGMCEWEEFLLDQNFNFHHVSQV